MRIKGVDDRIGGAYGNWLGTIGASHGIKGTIGIQRELTTKHMLVLPNG